MAEVYPWVDARMARMAGVKKVRRAAAVTIGAKAKAKLASHRAEGDSSIKVQHGPVDSLVILDDPAALSIEFGRGAYTRKSDGAEIGPMEGLHILSSALHG